MTMTEQRFLTDEEIERLNADDILYNFVKNKGILNESGNFDYKINASRDFDKEFLKECCEKAFKDSKDYDGYIEQVEELLYDVVYSFEDFNDIYYDVAHDCLKDFQNTGNFKIQDYDILLSEIIDCMYSSYPIEVDFKGMDFVEEIFKKLNKK